METQRKTRLIELAKAALVRSLWASIGRRNLVRLARFLTNESRFDGPNVMDVNGETMVQGVVLRRAHDRGAVHIVDVGANVGDWSLALLRAVAGKGSPQVHLHCLEPAPAAFEVLKRRLAELGGVASVELLQAAASAENGEAELHLVGDATGINSLHARSDVKTQRTIRVQLLSLDSFAEARRIPRLTLVKCDAEGHDYSVLEGARSLLQQRRIDAFQFEYNWRWVDARHYLRDAFELAAQVGYSLGKITPAGIEWYDGWDAELESFREGNYLLAEPSARGWFPATGWWKQ